MFIIILVGIISGCASTSKQPLTVANAKELRGQKIVQTKRESPSFLARTVGRGMFGMVGVAVMMSVGNSIVAENNISDPAEMIATGLIKELENTYGVKPTNVRISVSTGNVNDVSDAVRAAARYVIDVETRDWGFGPLQYGLTRYRSFYMAKVRLIDSVNQVIVADGFCNIFPESAESDTNAPTYDELLANNASLLKKDLANVAEKCVANLKSEILTL